MTDDQTLSVVLANATQVARETAQRTRQSMKALKAALKTAQCENAKHQIRQALDTSEHEARRAADKAIRAGVWERAFHNGVIPLFRRSQLLNAL